ncbi:hypothetical protein L9F63_018106, partial [Diploptera punctata]
SDNNSPCPTPRSTSSWMDRRHSLLQSVTQQNFAPSYHPVHPSDIIFKFSQLFVTIVCTGSYSEGVKRVSSSTTAQMMPYFVCSCYLIVTPVVLISYTLGHHMPDILTRIFNAVGGVLNLAAGLVALESWRDYKSEHRAADEQTEKEGDPPAQHCGAVSPQHHALLCRRLLQHLPHSGERRYN